MRGVVAVIPSNGRLLVIRRSRLVRAPLAFCFPGGEIEGAEDEAQALVRELNEELGARVSPRRRLWTSRTPWDVDLAWWLAELADQTPFNPSHAEVESIHWLDAKELKALPELLESNRHFLAAWDNGEIELTL